MCVGESSARPFLMLAEQDTDGEEANVLGVRSVSGPIRNSHHNWDFLQTEWVQSFIDTSILLLFWSFSDFIFVILFIFFWTPQKNERILACN